MTWTLAGLATVLTAFRLYVRQTKLGRLYWDDAFHCFAWALLVTSAGLYTADIPVIYKVTGVTSGSVLLTADFLENEVPKYINYQFATFTLFYCITWSVKLSFLLFYRRFFLGLRTLMLAWWAVLAFTAIAFISNLVIWLEVCGSPAAYFDISAFVSGPQPSQG